MQTFLPLPSFRDSARCLDRERLGKQRLEARQILDTLLGHSLAWASHPAVKMWAGYELALCEYAITVCGEWRDRGYQDVQIYYFLDKAKEIRSSLHLVGMPSWVGEERFHASHRSNLLRKKPEWYKVFGWTEPPDLPYWWPSKEMA